MFTLSSLALGLLAIRSCGSAQEVCIDPAIAVEIELVEFCLEIPRLFEPIFPSPGGLFEPCRVRSIEAESYA
jgi:hypothetical protein